TRLRARLRQARVCCSFRRRTPAHRRAHAARSTIRPAATSALTSSNERLSQQREQILTVAVLRHRMGDFFQRRGIDIAEAKRDFLWTRDLEPLPAFDGLYVLG